MMDDLSIIIIGGGIAGLSTGCYGQMNGYHTEIFELHNQPGGLCTSWTRKQYTFDGCLHWLVGTDPQNGMNRYYHELGALGDTKIVNHDEFYRVVHPSGKTLILYTDADRLEKHILELDPLDAPLIKEMCRAIRRLSKLNMVDSKPRELMGLSDLPQLFNMLPALGTMKKFGSITMADYVKQFKDPVMRDLIQGAFDAPDFPALVLILTLAFQHGRNAGYPVGGSLRFSKNIEKRYLDLGGKIHYNARVVKILVENDKAVGVQLENGEVHRAGRIVSAADGYNTIFNMLEGKYIDDQRRQWYARHPTFQPIVMVSFGIKQDLSNTPHQVTCLLDRPLDMAGEKQHSLGWKHYGYDPTLAPQGKSVVEVMLGSSYEFWKDLSGDSEHYEAEKKNVAIQVMDFLETRLPGFKESIEVVDVATPLTFERYTGNWKGIWEGWTMTKDDFVKTLQGQKTISDVLPGLESFFMVGQWTTPGGGVPPAVTSGRNLIQLFCAWDKKKFTTSLSE